MTRAGVLALVALDAALLAAVLVPLEPASPPADAVAPAPPAAVAEPAAAVPPPIDHRGLVAELLARPVFTPDRRPAPAGPVAAAPESLVLVGVVVSGRRRVALVRADGGRTLRLAVGDRIGPLTVAEIAPDRIRVRDGATVRDLPLLRNHPPPPASVAAQKDTAAEPAEAPRID